MPNLLYITCGFRFLNPLESLNMKLLKEIGRELKLRAPQFKALKMLNYISWKADTWKECSQVYSEVRGRYKEFARSVSKAWEEESNVYLEFLVVCSIDIIDIVSNLFNNTVKKVISYFINIKLF